jgi:hypothetical protein
METVLIFFSQNVEIFASYEKRLKSKRAILPKILVINGLNLSTSHNVVSFRGVINESKAHF